MRATSHSIDRFGICIIAPPWGGVGGRQRYRRLPRCRCKWLASLPMSILTAVRQALEFSFWPPCWLWSSCQPFYAWSQKHAIVRKYHLTDSTDEWYILSMRKAYSTDIMGAAAMLQTDLSAFYK